MDLAPLPLYRRITKRYDFVAEGNLVYVRFREVADDPSETLRDFADRLFTFIDEHEIEDLVFDLRGNGGGNGYLIQPLVLGTIRAERVNRPGHLFAIVDRGTFSAAMMFAAELERTTHALFVGEPTGSPTNTYGDTERFNLPASGIGVKISALYWQGSDPRDRRPAILPDLPAPLDFADHAQGRDPSLEAIRSYRAPGGRPSPPNENWARPSQRREWPAMRYLVPR